MKSGSAARLVSLLDVKHAPVGELPSLHPPLLLPPPALRLQGGGLRLLAGAAVARRPPRSVRPQRLPALELVVEAPLLRPRRRRPSSSSAGGGSLLLLLLPFQQRGEGAGLGGETLVVARAVAAAGALGLVRLADDGPGHLVVLQQLVLTTFAQGKE